ncbi:MAG TPA: prephenate dehydratase domain-containing protein [Candidatus Acidoferrales bacterium]|nr:prephenate dehydratase domain-containing protein [Candidatus Acidoferrales bacterium]
MKTSPPRVAFQGERGAFSEQAARQLLGDAIRVVPRPTFESLFRAIGERAADYALVPIENSLAGSVQRNYDLLRASRLVIVGETVLPIAHCLIGCRGSTIARIRSVESHPVALAQCECFFARNPKLRRIASDDTAGSVRAVVASGDASRAAIASAFAAKFYGGKILRRHVEDHAENYTRFLLLAAGGLTQRAGDIASWEVRDGAPTPKSRASGRNARPISHVGAKAPTHKDIRGAASKLSLVFRLAHRPGTLSQSIAAFAKRRINLVKIESRPLPGRPWEYCFYIDLQVSPNHPGLAAALRELAHCSHRLRILGHYPSARRNDGGIIGD